MFSTNFSRLKPLVLALALAFGLAACGGSGSGDPADTPPPVAESGDVYISVTDAEGDFVRYLVAVDSIMLERADGAFVETLPLSAEVDFAELTDLTEFISAATIPSGVYVAGSITLNYENADIQVESSDGSAIEATLVDEAGNPVGTTTLEIRLDDQRQLVVRRGLPALLTVDFDLAASHTVDTSVTPAEVMTEPFLLADVDPIESKRQRVRGPLVDVDLADNSYRVAVRPWRHFYGDFGRLTVNTTADTVFEIDGDMYTGSEGIEALALKSQGTPTAAFGKLDVTNRSYTATEVYAGSSVPGADSDAVHGVVVARSGTTLTVRGLIINRGEETTVYRDEILVEIGPDTVVRKAGMTNADLTTDAVSVGQRINARGELSVMGGTIDGDAPTLDATTGALRMLRSWFAGSVTETAGTQFVVNLQHLNRRPVEIYAFDGTGQTTADDANPDAYDVEAGLLDIGNLAFGTPVKVQGFVTPFGDAPPDFEASTIADFTESNAKLGIGWGPQGTGTPFAVLDASGIVPDLGNPEIGERHYIVRGGVLTDLLTLPAPVTIVPDETRPGIFAIREGQTITVHNNFENFVNDLALRFDGVTTARAIYAHGGVGEDLEIFRARRMLVILGHTE